MWMAIASQALVSVNELVVVAFKAGAEQLTAAAEALGGHKNPKSKMRGWRVINVWMSCM